MPKRAVIFDFGGVLFKTQDYTPRHRWDTQLGLPLGSVERVVHGSEAWREAQTGTRSLADYWVAVAQALNISPHTAQTLLAQDFYRGDVLDTQVLGVVARLRTEGHTVGLLSNDTAALLRPRLQKLGISEHFEPLLISSEIGVMKPHPAAYRALLDRLARAADEVIFIDDMLANIEGAQALGIHGIHYTYAMPLWDALSPLLIC